jgi:hypothetical protein
MMNGVGVCTDKEENGTYVLDMHTIRPCTCTTYDIKIIPKDVFT